MSSSFLQQLETCFDDDGEEYWGEAEEAEEEDVRYEDNDDMEVDDDDETANEEDFDDDGRGVRMSGTGTSSSSSSFSHQHRCIFDYIGELGSRALFAEFDLDLAAHQAGSRSRRRGISTSSSSTSSSISSSVKKGGGPPPSITSHVFSNRLEVDANFDLAPMVRALRADIDSCSPKARLAVSMADKLLLEWCESCCSFAFPNPYFNDLVTAAKTAKFSNLNATHLVLQDGLGASMSDSVNKPSNLLESSGSIVDTFDVLIKRRKLQWQDALHSALDLLLDGTSDGFVVSPDLAGLRRNGDVNCPLISFHNHRKNTGVSSSNNNYSSSGGGGGGGATDADADSNQSIDVYCTFVGVSAPMVARLRSLGVVMLELNAEDRRASGLRNNEVGEDPHTKGLLSGVVGGQRWASKNSEIKCFFVHGDVAVGFVSEVLLENVFLSSGKFFYGDLPYIISSTEFANSVKVRPVIDSIINKAPPLAPAVDNMNDENDMGAQSSVPSSPPSRSLTSVHLSGVFSTKAVVKLTSVLQLISRLPSTIQLSQSASRPNNNSSNNNSNNDSYRFRNSNSNRDGYSISNNFSNGNNSFDSQHNSQPSDNLLFLFRPGMPVASHNLMTNFEPKAAVSKSVSQSSQRTNQLATTALLTTFTGNPFIISTDSSYKSFASQKEEQRSDYSSLLLKGDAAMAPLSASYSFSEAALDTNSLPSIQARLRCLERLDNLSKLSVLVQYYTHNKWLDGFLKSEEPSFIFKIKISAKDSLTKTRWKRLNYSSAVPHLHVLSEDHAAESIDTQDLQPARPGSAARPDATLDTLTLDVLVLDDVRWTGISSNTSTSTAIGVGSEHTLTTSNSDTALFPGMVRRHKLPAVSLIPLKE